MLSAGHLPLFTLQDLKASDEPAAGFSGKYHVINISKGGITIQSRPDSLPLTTSWLEGSIMFLDGEALEITGDIVWIIGDKMGVKFSNFLPGATILREQSRIEKA